MEPVALCNWAVILFTFGFSYAGFRSPRFTEKFIFWPQAILGGRQYYRLLTSGFLHADGMHLGMNMLSLYFFGPGIEWEFGWEQFLGIYFAAIVGGNLLALLVHRHHDYRAYGASGGVSGIVLAAIFLSPGMSVMFPFIPFGVPGWLYAVAYLGASFYGMKKRVGNVGHDAHLGGALVGLYTAAALHPGIIRQSPGIFAVVSAGTILLFLYLAKNPLFLAADFFHLPKFAKPGKAAARSDLPEYKRDEGRMDAILAKISEKGIHSLTPEEQAVLRETSDKYKRRATVEKPKSGLTI